MRRYLPIALLIALAAPASASAITTNLPARALLTSCERSVDADERRAVFEGRMRRIAGAQRLQMRFTLLRRDHTTVRWTGVEVPEWKEWVSSDPGVAGYRYTKEIVRLAAPASYRTAVRFRWLDANGAVIAQRGARSRACRQPDLRPDLRVRRIEVRGSDDPGTRRYVVTVRNAGRSRSAVTALSLGVDGQEPETVAVPSIAPRDSRRVAVVALRCGRGGTGISALADAFGEVDERDESDNGLTRSCPL